MEYKVEGKITISPTTTDVEGDSPEEQDSKYLLWSTCPKTDRRITYIFMLMCIWIALKVFIPIFF